MTHSLEVYEGQTLVFSSDGKWLHPLFELERYLSDTGLDAGKLGLMDSIIGRAAAMLIVRMGIKTVYGRIMSALALETFAAHRITPGYGELVERIACRTEELLAESSDIEAAYLMLRERADKSASGGKPA